MACVRSPPHYAFVHIIIVDIFQFLLNKQKKCEQYWNQQLDKPYDAGRSFTVVTTGYRDFADYVVRDMTLTRVSLSNSMQSPKHCIQPGMNMCIIMMYCSNSCNSYNTYVVTTLCFFLQPSDVHDGAFCLKQFQYTGWPDHGVPCQSSSLVKFIQQVRNEFEGTGAPIVVHCR